MSKDKTWPWNTVGRPVGEGLVASLARPGGKLTGGSVMVTELTPKRLEMLSELAPQASVIALLVNRNSQAAEPTIREAQEAGRAKGVQLPILKAGSEGEIDAAFASLGQLHADALLQGSDAFFLSRREQLVARIPAFQLGIRRQLQHLRHGGCADDDPAIGKSEPEFHPAFSHLFYPSTA